MKQSTNFIISLLLFTFFLSGCAHLRTEFYRDETKHLYETGCQFYKQGDYENSRTLFEETVSLDPDYGPAHAALGNLAMIREEYENAYNHYQQAISCDPELRKELLPFLMVSNMHKVREPLTKAGVDLAKIFPLFMADKKEELQLLFEEDLPIELLAKDSVSLTPGQLAELHQKASEVALYLPKSSSYRLFVSYLLFNSERFDQITGKLLGSIIRSTEGDQLQDAYVLLGRLHERMGDNNEAVDAYLAAVDAGKPLEDVAHYLARIYQVDIAKVIPEKNEPAIEIDQQESNKLVSTLPIVDKSQMLPTMALEKKSDMVPEPKAILITKPE